MQTKQNKKIQKISDNMIQRFITTDNVRSAVRFLLKKEGSVKNSLLSKEVDTILKKSYKKMHQDDDWVLKLTKIFGGDYPKVMREFIHAGAFAFKKHQDTLSQVGSSVTIESFSCDYVSSLKRLQSYAMAPQLLQLSSASDKVNPTADHERFTLMEGDGVNRSALVTIETYNRPAYGVKKGWIFDDGRPPKCLIPAKIMCSEYDEALLKEFMLDLKNTFSFRDLDSYAGYIAYLMQPYFSHEQRGLMPAYHFAGPTKSGKGYLSHGLPNVLYRHRYLRTTILKKLPESLNQMETFLWAVKDSIYVVFDEVKNATEDQMKVIDALTTSDYLTARRLYSGYVQIPNDFVISMTSVSSSFTDETAGRLIAVQLTKSDPNAVSLFHGRWKEKGGILLSTLCKKLSSIEFQNGNFQKVPDRRDGFSLLAHALKECFQIDTTFPIEGFTNEFLDFVADLYRIEEFGDLKNGQKRLTLKVLREAFKKVRSEDIEVKAIEARINTCLAYGSTKNHPVYKDRGYMASDGRGYHIRWAVEGRERRKFLYVKPAK